MADDCWILVANGSHARLFGWRAAGQVRMLRDLINTEACGAPGTGAQEADFAGLLVDLLRAAAAGNCYRHLVLVCPAGFLDLLRADMHEALARTVVAQIADATAFADLGQDMLEGLPRELFSATGGLPPHRSFEGVR